MTSLLTACVTMCAAAFLFAGSASAQDPSNKQLDNKITTLSNRVADYKYSFDKMDKRMEDILLFQFLGEVAYVDKVRLPGPPRWKTTPTGNEFADQFLDNDLIFYCYIFIPRNTDQSKKYPLVILPHGGIHGTFGSGYSHVVREWIAQGYIVIAPDYRGSTGYGKGAHRNIDYGGLEVEDALASRDYMVENYSIVDGNRVGMVGWSHGGMITLMNILKYPDKFACGYAGVPVSDVAFRLAYKGKGYESEFSAAYHVGKTPAEWPEEYARRSPVTYAKDLRKPLMITTAENDDDVGAHEVQRMIDALKKANKNFEYKVYPPMPGAHLFERIDSKEATQARYEMHKFIEKYLKPDKPFKTYEDMRKAGYYFN